MNKYKLLFQSVIERLCGVEIYCVSATVSITSKINAQLHILLESVLEKKTVGEFMYVKAFIYVGK